MGKDGRGKRIPNRRCSWEGGIIAVHPRENRSPHKLNDTATDAVVQVRAKT